MNSELKFGCSVEQDSDGDWVIVPPIDVTIFSVPGEPFLLAASTEQEANEEASAYLNAILADEGGAK